MSTLVFGMLMSGLLACLPKAPAKVLVCLQDSILVAGYPLGSGSESLSITKGIVSRVVMARYSTAQTSNKLLGVQIDAAINFGNRYILLNARFFFRHAAASWWSVHSDGSNEQPGCTL